MRSLPSIIAVAAVLGAAPFVHAQTIDVRTGLWESTTTMQMSGMPPVDTSKMPPEARARVEEAMKKNQGTHTNTNKSCVTKEMLEKGLDFGKESANCKRTVITSSRTVQEFKMECTGKQSSTANIRIEALSREAVKGTMKSTSTDGVHTMNMNGTFAAKWVSEACPDKK